MALILKPIESLINEINEKNTTTGAKFAVGDLVFKEKSFDADTGAREVVVTAKEGLPYFGKQTVSYTRLSLAKYFQGVTVSVVLDKDSVTKQEIVEALADRYGMPDFEILSAEPDANDPDGYDFDATFAAETVDISDSAFVKVTIEPSDQSLGWYGSLDINVYNAAHDLGQIIADNQLDGLKYPDDTKGEKTSLSVLTTPVTFFESESSAATAEDLTPLATVGTKLDATENAKLIAAIVGAINDEYEFAGAKDADLTAVLAGAEVKETTYTGTETEATAVTATLAATETEGYKGNVLLKWTTPAAA